jgi:hypothetical protein
MSFVEYAMLTQYGNIYPLDVKIDDCKSLVKWTENNFTYVKYNPRKDINRWGLSITSLNGNLDGIPDLDSLLEYNKENNTKYKETDFTVKTPVAEHPDIKKILEPFEGSYHRAHLLRLDQGGFFPPHRDLRKTHYRSFRIIVPLQNVNAPDFNFVLEDKIINWELGRMYFVDTAKMHYLFNCSIDNPSYWIVLNIDVNSHTVNIVTSKFLHK